MNPEDVWVIFNSQNNTILHVFAIEEMAKRKEAWYHDSKYAPFTGTLSNYVKIKAQKLSDVISDLKEYN